MTTLSVLICTYNRPAMLELALRALLSRTFEIPDQVIVVNGGDDRSDQVVERYMGRTNAEVKLVKTYNKNLAASRNVGLPQCTGDIVAWTDDDAEVFPDWVSQMKCIHAAHPEAGCVGGAVLGADSETRLLSRISDVAAFSSPPHSGYVRTIAGVNVSYKRSVLQRVGLQDERFFRGEDVDFNWRIKKLGYEIYYDPAIKVLHHHRPDLTQSIYQFYMYGRAYFLVRSKWPEMYRIYPLGSLRLREFLKLIYFVASTAFEPFVSAMKMPRRLDRILALPVFYILHIAWKTGMLIQKYRYQAETL